MKTFDKPVPMLLFIRQHNKLTAQLETIKSKYKKAF